MSSSTPSMVLLNPGAGKARRDLNQVRATIADSDVLRGAQVEACEDWEAGCRLTLEAVREGCSVVVAAGGDGTVNSVVSAVMRSDPPRPRVGVLPLGTGNDLARSLGIPADLAGGLDVLDRDETREIDVLRVRQGEVKRYCVNVSAGGFGGQVDEAMSGAAKQTWGPLAYPLKALGQMTDVTSYHALVEIDGRERLETRTCNIVIANGRFAAGGVPVAPEALLDDGLFDLVILESAPVPKLALVVAQIAAGRHLDHELVTFVRARTLKVIPDPPDMGFNVDGELIGEGSLEVEVIPRALRVWVGDGEQRAF